MRFILLLLLAVSSSAFAQYSGRGVDTCLAYANKDTGAKVVFDRDANLTIEKYTRKVGSQFVSSVLLGNGAILYPQGVPIELSFMCLLASDRQAVYFGWVSRTDASVLVQCRRTGDAGQCLESLLTISEQDLTQLYSAHLLEARAEDAKAGNEEKLTAFRKSNDAFKAYRDAECARRGMGDEFRACLVELSRRRALDLR